MSEKDIHLNESAIENELKELVRNSVKETLNDLLEQEAQALTNAAKYERTQGRQGYRARHCERDLLTSSGEVKLRMPQLKGVAYRPGKHREDIHPPFKKISLPDKLISHFEQQAEGTAVQS